MSAWILIITLQSSYGVTSQQVDNFKTKESCEYVKNQAMDNSKIMGPAVFAFCLEDKK